jgi:hypothetical protein
LSNSHLQNIGMARAIFLLNTAFENIN